MGKPKGLPKTGGRKVGTPNKANILKQEHLELLLTKHDFDPMEALFKIAIDESNPLEVRVGVLKEIVGYLYSKKKAIELETNINLDSPVRIYLPQNGTESN